MITKLLFFSLLTYAAAFEIDAQESSKLAECRKIQVRDSDKRGFNDLKSFAFDIDGDGEPATITPRTYAVKNNRKAPGKPESKIREVH